MSDIKWVRMNLPPSPLSALATEEAFTEAWEPLGWVQVDDDWEGEEPVFAFQDAPEPEAAQAPEDGVQFTGDPQDAPAPAEQKKGR